MPTRRHVIASAIASAALPHLAFAQAIEKPKLAN